MVLLHFQFSTSVEIRKMKINSVSQWTRVLLVCGALVACSLLYITLSAQAATNWYVTPTGAGNRDGRSSANAFNSIQQALDAVQPGDTIYLGDGDYFQALITKRHGTANAPITIVGSANAVLRGAANEGRIFQINHDYYVLDGWTINGHDGSGNSTGDYRDKLLYVHGQAAAYGGEVRRGPRGLEVRNMRFMNAGGECIRLRYFVQQANIHHNTISNCGIYDFVLNGGGKNGEGIYIGTAADQWGDGKNPTNEADGSNANYVHHNVFNTQGNECTEVKEGGTGNIIEYNDCTGNKDPEAAGFASRGDGNIFRYNTIYGHVGGGLRFGGHVVNGYQFGVRNAAYGNTIYANSAGGIKFQVKPQEPICGNNFSGPNGQTQNNPAFGSYASDYSNQVSATCSTNVPPTPTAAQPTATAVQPTATAVPPTATAVQPTAVPPTATPTATPGDRPAPEAGLLYLSAESDGKVDNISFKDEDILAFDQTTERWQLYFDGSDVGISGADIDALAILDDGSLLFSFITGTSTPGLGNVDDSDIVRFVPSALGPTTAGQFQVYFDGSDVGLTKDSEDIDALSVRRDGSLIVSTTGDYNVPGLTGNDKNLLAFTPSSLGANTAGVWSLYVKGADIGLQDGNSEDISSLWLDEQTPNTVGLYLSTLDDFEVNQLSGDNNDLIACQIGTAAPCAFQRFWAGDEHSFDDETIDAFARSAGLANNQLVVAADVTEDDGGAQDDVEPAAEALQDPNTPAEDPVEEESAMPYQIFLPTIIN